MREGNCDEQNDQTDMPMGDLGCGVAWAQPEGFIEGTVTEEAGEALPGANIAVRSPAEYYKAGTTADADGQFRIAVPAGNYQVDASNVLDQAYQSFVGTPAVGRLVFGQVGLRF